MISPAELDLARLTRADLDEVREALLDPSLGTLLDAAPVLERSAEALRMLERSVRCGTDVDAISRSRLRNEILGLRRSLDGVQALISNAASFHTGWAGLVGACATSYSPVGNPVYAPAEVSQMLVRG